MDLQTSVKALRQVENPGLLFWRQWLWYHLSTFAGLIMCRYQNGKVEQQRGTEQQDHPHLPPWASVHCNQCHSSLTWKCFSKLLQRQTAWRKMELLTCKKAKRSLLGYVCIVRKHFVIFLCVCFCWFLCIRNFNQSSYSKKQQILNIFALKTD